MYLTADRGAGCADRGAWQIWEPPFDSTDNTFPCSVNRISGPLATSDHMYLLNHFLDIDVLGTGILISDPGAASTTNGVASYEFFLLCGSDAGFDALA